MTDLNKVVGIDRDLKRDVFCSYFSQSALKTGWNWVHLV